jgi:hypothetical protein
VANISVIATSHDGTRAALWTAAELASGGAAKVWLFVRAGQAVLLPRGSNLNDATVVTYSGRAEDLIQLIPRSGSVVVGGCGGLWWPTPEQQLARKLAQLGYRVIFALSEDSRSPHPIPSQASAESLRGRRRAF